MPSTNAELCRQKRVKKPEIYRAFTKKCYDNNNGKEKSHARVIRFRLYKNEVKRLMNMLLD